MKVPKQNKIVLDKNFTFLTGPPLQMVGKTFRPFPSKDIHNPPICGITSEEDSSNDALSLQSMGNRSWDPLSSNPRTTTSPPTKKNQWKTPDQLGIPTKSAARHKAITNGQKERRTQKSKEFSNTATSRACPCTQCLVRLSCGHCFRCRSENQSHICVQKVSSTSLCFLTESVQRLY